MKSEEDLKIAWVLIAVSITGVMLALVNLPHDLPMKATKTELLLGLLILCHAVEIAVKGLR